MKKVLSVLLLFILLSAEIMAGVIKGTITDKQNKEPLTGATIQIGEAGTGAVADIDGNYKCNVKNGTYTVEVKYVGYKTIRQSVKIRHWKE